MPLYEYLCQNCNFKYEVIKSLETRHSDTCPKCGRLALKLISPTNFTFGWTISDDITRFKKDEFVKNI